MIRIAVAATAPGEAGAERSLPSNLLAQAFWCRPIRDLRAGRHRSRGPTADHFIEIVRASGLRICSITQLSTTSWAITARRLIAST